MAEVNARILSVEEVTQALYDRISCLENVVAKLCVMRSEDQAKISILEMASHESARMIVRLNEMIVSPH